MNRGPWILALLALSACRGPADSEGCDPDAKKGDLIINEVVSKNEGTFVDRTGATDDWVELVNVSDRALNLGDFSLYDENNQGRLPLRTLGPGGRTLIWLDKEPEQGGDHLPFKISSDGERLGIASCNAVIDEVRVPALAANEAYAKHPDSTGPANVCRYATPRATNGPACSPPAPYGLVKARRYREYDWPEMHPPLPRPLAISELALSPAAFIELQNTGEEPVLLADYTFELAPTRPGRPFPAAGEGRTIELGEGNLLPGEWLAIPIFESDVAEIRVSSEFEGVATLFAQDGGVADRIDFIHFPVGASLARLQNGPERPVYCDARTPGEENDCTILESREIGDRVRGLRTLSDFERLARGGSTLDMSAVKFVMDLEQSGSVHFLSSEKWPLHYSFVRDVIYQDPPLDRCDPEEDRLFYDGWRAFSIDEYFSPTGRHFHLGTLVHHGSGGQRTVEYTPGDAILASDIRDSFFAVTARVLEPRDWSFRPQTENQVEKAVNIDGELPIIDTNEPFADLLYQPLTHGVGFGVLTFVPSDQLHSAPLGPQVLLVTDDVPNDIPLVGGLITQAFQTPLAHVNVLSQSRGTPNMALRNALENARIEQHLGELVRLEVRGNDFSIELAEPAEAGAFWETFVPSGPQRAPRLNDEEIGLVDLKDATFEDLPAIGAKAAQFAELYRVDLNYPGQCANVTSFYVPHSAFAIPVAYSIEHYADSGAKDFLAERSATDEFQTNPSYRRDVLLQAQEKVLQHPVASRVLSRITSEILVRFAGKSVRLRSSSNAEDLTGFSGAGLYTSMSARASEPGSIERALRVVWASLYNPRAYDERELARIDHSEVAMGVLVHEAFPLELANGVGVSRNINEPNRGDIFYFNVQAGEASVTNPAPGVTTEAYTYQWNRPPTKTQLTASSLTFGEAIMSESEELAVGCALDAIHRHFRPLLDPEGEDPWFSMEIEFKLSYPSRKLVVKQARPHTFAGFEPASDCREF
jgi:hypothetical protein